MQSKEEKVRDIALSEGGVARHDATNLANKYFPALYTASTATRMW